MNPDKVFTIGVPLLLAYFLANPVHAGEGGNGARNGGDVLVCFSENAEGIDFRNRVYETLKKNSETKDQPHYSPVDPFSADVLNQRSLGIESFKIGSMSFLRKPIFGLI